MSKTVITHSGIFHADEVMATAILDILGKWNKVVTRTRNLDFINSQEGNAYIIDVGGVHSGESLRFDHHQDSFDSYFDQKSKDKGIKMSSCGLIYYHFGKELFGDRENVEYLHEKFYRLYLEEIDANDNGVSELKEEYTNDVFRYHKCWTSAAIVGNFNGSKVADTGSLAQEQDNKFLQAVEQSKILLTNALTRFLEREDAYQDSKKIIEEAAVSDIHGRVMIVLDKKCDYTQALRDHDKIFFGNKLCLTVLPREDDKNQQNDKWQVHTVNMPGKKFKRKVDIIPEGEAKKVIGDDLIFVHKNQFVAVTKSRHSAYELARASLEAHAQREKKKMELLLMIACVCGVLSVIVFMKIFG